jgi:endoglucanase
MYLEQLSNAFGVSSVEDEVRKIISEAAKPYADEWHADTMGNLFFTRRSRSAPAEKPPLRVMVTAHMDEVGFVISKINSNGRLKFKPIGGFDPRVLLGKVLVVGQDKIPGVIGLKPIHLLSKAEAKKAVSIRSMYIDVGAPNDKGGGVKIGDFATFATKFGHLGGTRPRKRQGLVKGKAFDNRAGCAVLLELLREDYPVDLIAVFTVQEEVGLRGAKVAAYTANPDVAFVLECTAADDLPPAEEDGPEGFPRLGAGPAITVMDNSFIADRQLVDLLLETAEKEGLPHQFKRPGIGGTDAGAIHLAREGIPSSVVSIPARYIHAPAAVLDLADFWRVVTLMKATLQRLPIEE